ncbi:MAG: hypothetical protein HC838_09065 [Spirulinaceae cyanobacterium RM2_2_10]|nr:hypothetical protein [Spirulinaceae cyanobacterium SM2_1_0]NJO20168.1 hypothetical protein [Spirulinaceae cyanobacterium RM2_2_10]
MHYSQAIALACLTLTTIPASWSLPALARGRDCPPSLIECPDRGDEDLWADTAIPFIISPRRTDLLTTQPLLRWNPVAGATRYTVTLSGETDDWTVETSNTQIQAPPLQRGQSYLLIVEADTGAASLSEDLVSGGLEFQVLDAATAEVIAAEVLAIRDMPTDPTEKVLAIARFFRRQDLIADALAELEILVPELRSPAVYLLLGDLYREDLQLAPPALPYYEQAVAQGQKESQEFQARAHDGLAEVYAAMGRSEDALAARRRAIDLYEQSGNLNRARELERQLEEWLMLR